MAAAKAMNAAAAVQTDAGCHDKGAKQWCLEWGVLIECVGTGDQQLVFLCVCDYVCTRVRGGDQLKVGLGPKEKAFLFWWCIAAVFSARVSKPEKH